MAICCHWTRSPGHQLGGRRMALLHLSLTTHHCSGWQKIKSPTGSTTSSSPGSPCYVRSLRLQRARSRGGLRLRQLPSQSPSVVGQFSINIDVDQQHTHKGRNRWLCITRKHSALTLHEMTGKYKKAALQSHLHVHLPIYISASASSVFHLTDPPDLFFKYHMSSNIHGTFHITVFFFLVLIFGKLSCIDSHIIQCI